MEVLGAGKAWNNRRFFYWIYLASDASAQAKWLHNLIKKKVSIWPYSKTFTDSLLKNLT